MRLAPLPTYTPPACLNAPRALSTCIPPACAACASRLCAIRLPTSALPAPCGSKRLPTCTSCACAARPFRLRRAPFPPAPRALSACTVHPFHLRRARLPACALLACVLLACAPCASHLHPTRLPPCDSITPALRAARPPRVLGQDRQGADECPDCDVRSHGGTHAAIAPPSSAAAQQVSWG